MNIKSLLLGSAAALVAVSGARAADAVEVVAEPEPVEYVRICDTYGTGFYYIPGTETCLRVSGYIRYDIGVGSLGNEDVLDKRSHLENRLLEDRNDTYSKLARANFKLDARSETELGTLRGYMSIHFNYSNSVGTFDHNGSGVTVPRETGTVTTTGDALSINHAYIELGGFRIGKTDSLFSTFTDYAGGVSNDGIIPYGPFGTHQIAYTFDAGNGFTAAVALEEGSGGLYTLDSYIPHVVGGVGYSAGWGSIKAVVGYDAVYEEVAAKLRLDVKASDTISLFVMGGWRSVEDTWTDPFAQSRNGTLNYYGQWGGDWAIWGGATVQLSEKAAFNLELDYDDAENFAAVANIAYTVVPGFTVTPEVVYTDNFDGDNDGEFGGFIRFQRDF